MDTINDRNGKDLIEAEEIKKRWQEYTKGLYKKSLNNPDNHDDMVTHPEPDILDCGVKWVLGGTAANKASGGNEIPTELFKILKDDAIKVLQNKPKNLENSVVATGLEKISFHSNPKEGYCQKMLILPHNCTHFTC